jgi:molybdopterin-containing oxidoreductase family membrane subunit
MLIGLAVNVGMWFERFVIISLSLMHDHIPSAWDNAYVFTGFDWMILAGSFGVFITLLLAFSRIIPMVSIAELKADLLTPHHDPGSTGGHAGGHAEGPGHG